MTRTLIGLDYEGVPCVKITRGALDPVTTPDGEVGAFLYNSKLAADIKMTTIMTLTYAGANYAEPTGSSYADATHIFTRPGSLAYGQHYVTAEHVGSLYSLPLFDVKGQRVDNGRFVGTSVVDSYTGYQDRGGVWAINSAYNCEGWKKDYNFYVYGWIAKANCAVVQSWETSYTDAMRYVRNKLVVWRLPGDETAILNGSPQAPVVGQRSIEITSSACRVAKPGFDVRTATATQLAFDSASNPIKIIASADIAIPVGESYFDTGIDLPSTTLADIHYYVGSTIYFPAHPADFRLGADHWFSGSRIYFSNAFAACRARFMIYAYDETAATSGANDVLRQFDVAGQNVVQFLRPGAADPPAFADIILDSRWPALRVLAEGYIPVTANGEQTYTVNFDATGVFPMVKYMTVHGAGGDSSSNWTKEVRPPRVKTVGLAYGTPGWTKWQAGDSTYCMIGTGTATFKTFKGAPILSYFNRASDFSGSPTHFYDTAPIIGIRYYILGIPSS